MTKIPSFYEFNFPVKIISGHTALHNLPAELTAASVSRPLIITDQGVARAGLIQHVLDALGESAITVGALFDETPLESSTLVVNQLGELYRAKRCDSIVAVGGGSVIDTAKGVNIIVSLDGHDVRNFRGADSLTGPLRPLYVVPTTSGTGSEVTNSAVIADPEQSVKMLFSSEFLLPRAAFLDSRMTLTLPPRLTAATGMDALTHAMEATLSIQKNPMSDVYAWQAVRLISQYLRDAVEHPQEKENRLALANASTMAGVAFSNAMVGVVHSMGHATGGVAHVPHGVAMNIFLPFGLEFNLAKRREEIGELLLPFSGAQVFADTPESRRAERVINDVHQLKEDLYQLCGLPRTLSEAGVKREQLPAIAALAINDASALMNPTDLNTAEALALAEKAF